MPPLHPPPKGRGAKSNAPGRFESHQREDYDDGWGADGELQPSRVDDTLTPLKSRTIIAHNDSPDVGFSASINPYWGCSHGCI